MLVIVIFRAIIMLPTCDMLLMIRFKCIRTHVTYHFVLQSPFSPLQVLDRLMKELRRENSYVPLIEAVKAESVRRQEFVLIEVRSK